MNKTKIELQVISISPSQMQAGAYAMLLAEKDGPRQLPIIIGASEAQIILMELKGINSPRPLTHELFVSMVEVLGGTIQRALIYRAENGIFYSYVILTAGNKVIRMDSRTSDAIALALRAHAPIYIYEDVLEEEKLDLSSGGTDGQMDKEKLQRKPANRMQSIKVMQAALDKAIESEDYEQAAMLRDLINDFNQSENKD